MGTGGSCAARETTGDAEERRLLSLERQEHCRKYGELLGADERKTEQHACA